jgi:transcriptional regulator with GAF, ATPase, and Fis domain
MAPRLLGISGPLKGTTFALSDGEVSIGRDSSNHLWTVDPALSRRHCAVVGGAGRFTIRDLGSHNGTLINGLPIEQQQLRDQDQISVGESVLVFVVGEPVAQHERSPVEFAETAEMATKPVLLRQEDSLYLHSDRVLSEDSARVTSDLNSLLKIATGIGGIRDQEALDWQLLGMIFDVVPADRGAILHFDDVGEGEEFSSAAAWDRVRGPAHPVKVSRTVVRRVIRETAGLVVSNVLADEKLRVVDTLQQVSVQSLLCVPLVTSGKVIGVIYLDSQDPRKRFDENHLQVATAIAGLASLALENVRHWERLQEENRILRSEINLEHNMVGGSACMRELYEQIRRVAPTESTVLIQGESGTGKELVARAVHSNSARSEGPFVAINCAAITQTLLESELFGHEKGAFTGAVGQKKGKIEVAEGGTLFLDEISELDIGLQAKLLRVLQEREVERVGGTRPFKVDVRLIAATNQNLGQVAQDGRFRRDLYYRLNVVALTSPPLRERRDDLPALADHFIAKSSRRCRTRVKALSPEALSCLMNYDWPGNVRELENAIERAVVLGTAEVILPDDLPEAILESGSPAVTSGTKYYGVIKDSKKQLVLNAMQQAKGNYIEAAKILGLHPNSLLRLIRNLGLKSETKATSNPPAAD